MKGAGPHSTFLKFKIIRDSYGAEVGKCSGFQNANVQVKWGACCIINMSCQSALLSEGS